MRRERDEYTNAATRPTAVTHVLETLIGELGVGTPKAGEPFTYRHPTPGKMDLAVFDPTTSCNEGCAEYLAGATCSERAIGGQVHPKHIPFNIREWPTFEKLHTTGFILVLLDEYCRIECL